MTSTHYTQVPGPVGAFYGDGGISHAAVIPAGAKRIVTSGEGGLDLATGELVTSSLEAQIRAAFALVDQVLKTAGATKGLADAYKFTALLLDMKDEALLMKVFNELCPDNKPTFMTYAVAGLALEGMRVELQAEASIP
ncbi:Endoribonuclease L-PSP/chorismate mutase-like protein [Niveomyces insectorum RCEF 264]|uniref:Endoribonuclease L-PSP/chorismate mutase-like protein n=1 Tax=Niveomyces insectorum RCEF 264 TaxID=1081102 RepID=A0A167TA18_9HYPO|nr:Endoribonuclease L-PSP/chorismate mutase-like protein [Niveomyces insectorum RCEF 264]